MRLVYKVLIFGLILFLHNSCRKSTSEINGNIPKQTKTQPTIPQTVDFDFNDDQIYDFEIEYSNFTWDGINCSGDGISGNFKPLNQNTILLRTNERTLFLQYNDTIKNTAENPSYWDNFRACVVSISTLPDGNLWPIEWSVQSNQNQQVYYLGIKVVVKSGYSIGWLKLQVDKTSGIVEIKDKKITNASFIIVGK